MKQSGIPLYIQVQDYLIQQIQNGEFNSGDRLLSEHELSQIKGVSRLTVRKAYTNLIEKGILYSVQGKGTFVTTDPNLRNLLSDSNTDKAQGPNKVIGVIFPEATMFFSSILKELEECASKSGYALNIMFNDSVERENNAINTMISNCVSGIIITPLRNNGKRSYENYKLLLNCEIPTIMIGKPPLDTPIDYVMCDDVTATYNAVSYFIHNGRKSILRVFNSMDDEEALIERHEGFTRAIRDFLPQTTPQMLDCFDPNWQMQLSSLLTGPNKIDAIYADSDPFAILSYNSVVNAGVEIPRDLEIIGYNNIGLYTHFGINISSIEIPKLEMARRAFEVLENKIQHPNTNSAYATSSIFHTKLNHGATTIQR